MATTPIFGYNMWEIDYIPIFKNLIYVDCGGKKVLTGQIFKVPLFLKGEYGFADFFL